MDLCSESSSPDHKASAESSPFDPVLVPADQSHNSPMLVQGATSNDGLFPTPSNQQPSPLAPLKWKSLRRIVKARMLSLRM
ncbi:Autophagy-related protein 17 [Sesbania bispinosa]|nr:Autophagy-related protein 17 [Sesbania bispinosa]